MANVWANAQPVISTEEQETFLKYKPETARSIAKSQIEKAEAAYDEATQIKEWQGPISAWVQYRSFRNAIENIKETFAKAENETNPDSKVVLYMAAWRAARIAVAGIAEEARLNPNLYVAFARPAIDYVQSGFENAKNQLKEANNAMLIGAVVLGIVLLLKDSKK